MFDANNLAELLKYELILRVDNQQHMQDSSRRHSCVPSSASQKCLTFPFSQKRVVPDLCLDSLLQMFVTIVAT